MKAILAMIALLSTVTVCHAQATSNSEGRSQGLAVSYTCDGDKVLLKIDDEVINFGLPKVVTHVAVGETLNMVVGDSDYLLWPRLNGENQKALTVFKKTEEGLRIEREINMGGRTPGSATVPLKIERYSGDGHTETIILHCDVTMTFVK
jgi:hypothetical protein